MIYKSEQKCFINHKGIVLLVTNLHHFAIIQHKMDSIKMEMPLHTHIVFTQFSSKFHYIAYEWCTLFLNEHEFYNKMKQKKNEEMNKRTNNGRFVEHLLLFNLISFVIILLLALLTLIAGVNA